MEVVILHNQTFCYLQSMHFLNTERLQERKFYDTSAKYFFTWTVLDMAQDDSKSLFSQVSSKTGFYLGNSLQLPLSVTCSFQLC